MKKNYILYLASSLLLAGGLLSSCGNKEGGNNQENKTDNQAVDEAFTPGEKMTRQDSLNQIDQMVAAVEGSDKGINGTKYNAAFFNNPENQAPTPSPDSYAVTSSGLKYVVINPGKGKSPKATDKVEVDYVGELTDGYVFDSSLERGESIDFFLNQVIPGWTEGLQLMKEGGVAVFYIPANLAYGERGIQNPYTGEYQIPPSAPLLFWVQLHQVK